jgi:hypothetical protein
VHAYRFARFSREQLEILNNALSSGVFWWAVLGSNQWPLPCESSALPLS